VQRTCTPESTEDEEHLASVSNTSHYEAEVQLRIILETGCSWAVG